MSRTRRSLTVLAVLAGSIALLASRASDSSPATPFQLPELRGEPITRDVGTEGLDPALEAALGRARADAAAEGVELHINSGRRTHERQEQLWEEALAKYGSVAEASRWVASPDTSAHVTGDAIDIGPVSSAAWLEARGPAYGLCRIYDNEPWHFELRPDAATAGCPARYADAGARG